MSLRLKDCVPCCERALAYLCDWRLQFCRSQEALVYSHCQSTARSTGSCSSWTYASRSCY